MIRICLWLLVFVKTDICGFTCGGVRGDSCASSWHSDIGDVDSGSCFSCCQSAGACGKGCYMFVAMLIIWGISCIAAGFGYFLTQCDKNC
ncbi:hypothetical protein EB796_016865 [Bugula neritina]|uniref:Uncharacterized protein n=1 Tax=Bugula neritina TaxID=10212 RepID=A0A7J7JG95_BUGNE|nr:hypothetical protein EB796_016865 [Bugula neritina]